MVTEWGRGTGGNWAVFLFYFILSLLLYNSLEDGTIKHPSKNPPNGKKQEKQKRKETLKSKCISLEAAIKKKGNIGTQGRDFSII